MGSRKTRLTKLTKKVVEALKPAAEVYEVHDSDLKGFHVRVMPNGRKAFYFYYRNSDGIRRRPWLGDYHPDAFPVETARTKAAQDRGQVASGKDPSAERQENRHSETFADFAEGYLKDIKARVKPRTLDNYRREVRLHLIPAWGNKKLAAIKPAEIKALHKRLAQPRMVEVQAKNSTKKYSRERGGPVGANRVLALLKAMFGEAERMGLIPAGANPTRHVKPFAERPRESYLTPDEMKRLAESMVEEEQKSPQAVAALRLVLLTGARVGEVMTLQWEHVDAEAKCLRLTDSKTGSKVVHLNAPAIEVLTTLANMKEEGNPWVICGHKQGARLVNVAVPWDRIRKRAGLPNLRIHDLRHNFAGTAALLGMGLPLVGRLLGHTQAQTTLRYANLAPDPIQAASEATAAALVEAMKNGGAKVVDMAGGTEKAARAETGNGG